MAKRTRAIVLPKVPSQLIRIALADLAKVEEDNKHYVVEMRTWHSPISPLDSKLGRCAVCLAGAVIAQTCNVSFTTEAIPDDFPRNTRQLQALDALRRANLGSAFSLLGRKIPHDLPLWVYIPCYSRDKRVFRKSMRSLAAMLAKHGH